MGGISRAPPLTGRTSTWRSRTSVDHADVQRKHDADPKQAANVCARLSDSEPSGNPAPRIRHASALQSGPVRAVSAWPGVASRARLTGTCARTRPRTGGSLGLRLRPRGPARQRRPGRGGSIDGPGPVIGGGIIFVKSGYPTAGGTPGNVLPRSLWTGKSRDAVSPAAAFADPIVTQSTSSVDRILSSRSPRHQSRRVSTMPPMGPGGPDGRQPRSPPSRR